MLLQLCLSVVVFKTCSFNTQSHFTLMALYKTFCVTPLALHTRHLSCISDGIGQCLLSQTSSLATCDLTLGGLPNGLGILCSGLPCANIFLTRVNKKKSLCQIFLPHKRNEECSCWEWPGLTDERTIFCPLGSPMADGVTVCQSVTLIPIPYVMVIIHHNLWLYGFSSPIAGTSWIFVNMQMSLLFCHSTAIKSTLVPMQMSPLFSFTVLGARSCGIPHLFGLTFPHQ